MISTLATTASAQGLGADIAGLNLCLYGDCEARGTYVADPFGFANPATMTVGGLKYLPRGWIASGTYYRLNAGGVGINIGAASLELNYAPWVFQVTFIDGSGNGTADSLPGTNLHIELRQVRLATALDLEQALGLKGLSFGLILGVPGTTGNLDVASQGFSLAHAPITYQISVMPGLLWHTGERDWLGLGVMLDAERHDQTTDTIDPATFAPLHWSGTSDAWFLRGGFSALPFVPLGLADEKSSLGQYLGEVRAAYDVEYRNISPTGEPTRKQTIGYFGLETLLLPNDWNPLSDYMSLHLLGGVDTSAGWGLGAGFYGAGNLQFLSCNPAYSSRALAKSLGSMTNIWSANCAVAIPF